MSDIFDNLIEACKEVQNELRNYERNKDNVNIDINSLKGQKEALIHQVGELIKARDNAAEEVKQAKRSALEEIEQKKHEVVDIRSKLESERAMLAVHDAQTMAKLEELDKIKDDYGVKFADLADRERLIQNKLDRLAQLGLTLSQ